MSAAAPCYIDSTNMDLSKIVFSSIRQNERGGKYVNVNHRDFDGQPLLVRLPTMITPYGASESKEQDGAVPQPGAPPKWTYSVRFPESTSVSAESKLALQAMEGMLKLENHICNAIVANAKEWLGADDYDAKVVSLMLKQGRILRYPLQKDKKTVDNTRPPSIKIKLPCYNGVWSSEIFDEHGAPLYRKGGNQSPDITPATYISKGCMISSLIQCAGIWFMGNNIYITWNLKQAIVKKPINLIPDGICIMQISNPERAALEQEPPKMTTNTTATLVDDDVDNDPYEEDDEEEESASSSSSAAAPAPASEPVVASEPAAVEEPVVAKKPVAAAATTVKKTTTAKKTVATVGTKRKAEEPADA